MGMMEMRPKGGDEKEEGEQIEAKRDAQGNHDHLRMVTAF